MSFFLTAETDCFPTDAKQLREEYFLLECHSSRSNDLSVHARVDTTKKHRLLWESIKENDKYPHAECFEVKFGEHLKNNHLYARPNCSSFFFFHKLEIVALATDSSDVDTTEVIFLPTAKCIQNTDERRLVTRSGLQRLRPSP